MILKGGWLARYVKRLGGKIKVSTMSLLCLKNAQIIFLQSI